MPSIRDMYPDTYLKPEHLQGRRVRVTIEHVFVKNFWNDKEGKEEPAYVVRMAGKELPFILNKTQTFAVAGVLNTEDWTMWKGGVICLEEGKQRGKRTIVVSAPDGGQPKELPLPEQHPDTNNGELHPDSQIPGDHDEAEEAATEEVAEPEATAKAEDAAGEIAVEEQPEPAEEQQKEVKKRVRKTK